MTSATPPSAPPALPSIAIIGADAVVSASPATAVQLAHACLARGFDLAVPASWGDELVAYETLRRLSETVRGPAVACVCPFARARLQATGADLSAFALDIAPPPVALARYLRVVYNATGVRVTYIGTCPSAGDSSIDARVTPMEFFAELADRGISLVDQPRIFESVVPPDRRRSISIPGGMPTPERLWSEGGARVLVELDGRDVAAALAEHLVAPDRVLLDMAPALGCACSGVVDNVDPGDARTAVMEMEPPRSSTSVIDPGISIGFEPPPLRPQRAPDDRPSVAGTAAPASPPESLRSARQTLAATPGYWHMPVPFERPMSHDAPSDTGVGTPRGANFERFDAHVDDPPPRRKPAIRYAGNMLRAHRADGGTRPLPRAYAAHRKAVLRLRVELDAEVTGDADRADAPPREAATAVDRELAIDRSVEPAHAAAPPPKTSYIATSAPLDPAQPRAVEASGTAAAAATKVADAPHAINAAGAAAVRAEAGAAPPPLRDVSPTVPPQRTAGPMRVPPPPPRTAPMSRMSERIRPDARPQRIHPGSTPSREPRSSVLGTVLAVLTIVAVLAIAGFVALSLLRTP
ncbi:MAG TPA: hypothetical protein VFG84_03545 [Gemmatimonadaceae bacterium]|nr:hypothetical protein [Gemmatimonadaceae bacterium]